MSSISTDNTPHDQQLVHQRNPAMDIDTELVEVSPSSELTTRPFLGLGRIRSPAVSARSAGIRRIRTTAGPSRRPRPTVEDIQEGLVQVIDAANVAVTSIQAEQANIAQALGQSHQAAQSAIERTREDTRQTITAVTLTAAQQRELDSRSVAELREQDHQNTVSLILKSFDSLNARLDQGRIQQDINNQDMLKAFTQLEERIVAVEKRSHDKTIEDWRSHIPFAPGLRGGSGSPSFIATGAIPPLPSQQYIPPLRPRSPTRRYIPSPIGPEVQLQPERQIAEGDVTKFKPAITFEGSTNLESFLFSLNQSIRKYKLISDKNKLIALGDSLRGEALGWWIHQEYGTFAAAVTGLEEQFKDLGKHGEYLRKLNRLTQSSTVREFFKEAEKLNQYARLPEAALWLTLKQGLSIPLHAALVSYYPPPQTYAQWKTAALMLGAELDSIHTSRTAKTNATTKKPQQHSKIDRKEREARRERGACYECGGQGHSARYCPSKTDNKPSYQKKDKGKEKEKDKKDSKEIRITASTTTDPRKRRHQGEDHYPKSKREDVGVVRVTEITSDKEDEPREDTVTISDCDSDSDYDSGKD